jgi:acylglycerol lipase
MVAVEGARLFLTGAAGTPGRPALFLIPGYTDHVGRYGETFTHFLNAGCSVWGMDPRGHGRSTGPRGYVRRFGVYVDDLARALAEAQALDPGRRWVLVGHSTGGLTALTALLERCGEEPFGAVAGAVVVCPPLRIRRHVTAVQRFLGRVGSALLPWLSLPAPPDYANSHDPEAERERREDPLMFRTVNARWYMEMQRAAAHLLPRAAELDLPLLGLQADDDRVVDPAVSRDFFARCPRARYVDYPEMYHELLLETVRPRVWADMEAWLAEL